MKDIEHTDQLYRITQSPLLDVLVKFKGLVILSQTGCTACPGWIRSALIGACRSAPYNDSGASVWRQTSVFHYQFTCEIKRLHDYM